MYDPKSLCADEFIDHEEILATLAYAEENKNNKELIGQILEKAKPRRDGSSTICSGLTHREASVLLACEDPEILKSSWPITGIESSSLRPFICPTTVSMAVSTVLII